MWTHRPTCPSSVHTPLLLGLVVQSVLGRMKPGGGLCRHRGPGTQSLAQKHTHTEEGLGRPWKGALLLRSKGSTVYRYPQTAAEHMTAN